MTIWTNVHLAPDLMENLRSRAGRHELRLADDSKTSNLSIGSTDLGCRTADIALGQPAVDDLLSSTSLRWAHLTSAGYTRYDRDDLRHALSSRGAMLTNSSAVYDDPCAQHVLAFMLAHNRKHLGAVQDHHGKRVWTYRALRPAVRTLGGEQVLIVGFGAIGRRLVELLAPFGAIVSAVRRTVSGDEPVPTFGMSALHDLLSSADHVVNLLPSSPANAKLFNETLFERFKPAAAFYNVGRGDTVDQTALIAALETGTVGAAYLDVTSPEPLPAADALWFAPNCLITPHIAGGMQNEAQQLIDHFIDNLNRFDRGDKLTNRVI